MYGLKEQFCFSARNQTELSIFHAQSEARLERHRISDSRAVDFATSEHWATVGLEEGNASLEVHRDHFLARHDFVVLHERVDEASCAPEGHVHHVFEGGADLVLPLLEERMLEVLVRVRLKSKDESNHGVLLVLVPSVNALLVMSRHHDEAGGFDVLEDVSDRAVLCRSDGLATVVLDTAFDCLFEGFLLEPLQTDRN